MWRLILHCEVRIQSPKQNIIILDIRVAARRTIGKSFSRATISLIMNT